MVVFIVVVVRGFVVTGFITGTDVTGGGVTGGKITEGGLPEGIKPGPEGIKPGPEGISGVVVGYGLKVPSTEKYLFKSLPQWKTLTKLYHLFFLLLVMQ